MSNLVLSKTGLQVRPYIFEDTGVAVCSYEELCYYICHNSVLFAEDWCTFSLLHWISRDLQMEEIVRQMNGYSQNSCLQISVLLSCGDYMRKRDVDPVIEEIKSLQNGSRIQYYKKKGDCYLRYGKFFRARQEYQQLLKQEHLIPDKIFLGNIYHNIGVTYLMDRDIAEGKRYFLTALTNNRNKDTCFQYLLLIYLENGEPAVKTEALKLGLSAETSEEFIDMIRGRLEEAAFTGEKEMFRKIQFQKEQGNIRDYEKKIEYLLDQWKKQYRIQTS